MADETKDTNQQPATTGRGGFGSGPPPPVTDPVVETKTEDPKPEADAAEAGLPTATDVVVDRWANSLTRNSPLSRHSEVSNYVKSRIGELKTALNEVKA